MWNKILILQTCEISCEIKFMIFYLYIKKKIPKNV